MKNVAAVLLTILALFLLVKWAVVRWSELEAQGQAQRAHIEFLTKQVEAEKTLTDLLQAELDSTVQIYKDKKAIDSAQYAEDLNQFSIELNQLRQIQSDPNRTDLDKMTAERNFLASDTTRKGRQINRLRRQNISLESICLDERGIMTRLLAGKDSIIVAQDLLIDAKDQYIKDLVKDRRRSRVMRWVIGAGGLVVGILIGGK